MITIALARIIADLRSTLGSMPAKQADEVVERAAKELEQIKIVLSNL